MKKFIYSIIVLVIASCLHGCNAQRQSVVAQTTSKKVVPEYTNDWKFETNDLTRKLFYNKPSRMAIVGKDMNVDGAWSKVNMDYDSLKTGNWYIEQQRYGYEAIMAGIINNDTAAIDRGLLAFEWGMHQQQPDGSFSCPDNFHSTSFFVEAVAHACLQLQSSNYSQQYQGRIAYLKLGIEKTVNWMLLPTTLQTGIKRNAPYTHRRYLVAAAIGEAGVFCGNQKFIDQSFQFIQDGIALQDTAGFNPEKHGFDCSYHAVGLLFAHRYFDIVANNAQQKAMLPMFEKAYAWLLSKIDTSGNINVEGSTRTGFGQEKDRNGKPKNISNTAITNALLWWSLHQKDNQLATLAEKVALAGRNKAKEQGMIKGK